MEVQKSKSSPLRSGKIIGDDYHRMIGSVWWWMRRRGVSLLNTRDGVACSRMWDGEGQ